MAVITVDVGYSRVKVVTLLPDGTFKTMIFTSFVSQDITRAGRRDFGLDRGPEHSYLIDGKASYFIGDSAISESNGKAHEERDPKWYQNMPYALLLKAALVAIQAPVDEGIHLVLTLPLQTYAEGKPVLIQRYQNTKLDVETIKGHYQYHIDKVSVVPQGMAAIYHALRHEMDKGTYGVFDIGYKTLITAVTQDFTPVVNSSRSFHGGISNVTDALIALVENEYSCTLNRMQLDQLLRTFVSTGHAEIGIRGYLDPVDLGGYISDILEKVVHDDLERVGTYMSVQGLDKVVIAGGGAYLMCPHIGMWLAEQRIPWGLSPDPEFANAFGANQIVLRSLHRERGE